MSFIIKFNILLGNPLSSESIRKSTEFQNENSGSLSSKDLKHATFNPIFLLIIYKNIYKNHLEILFIKKNIIIVILKKNIIIVLMM